MGVMDQRQGSSTPFGQFLDARSAKLSPQLRRVFALLVLGCDDATIGFVLRLRRPTVRHYIDRVLMILGVDSRADVPLLYICERTPDLGEVLQLLFEPSALGRVSRMMTERARPLAAEQ